jgi:hypothetical protein
MQIQTFFMRTLFHILYIVALVNVAVFYFIKLIYIVFMPKFMLINKLKWFTNLKPTRRELTFYCLAVIFLIMDAITAVIDHM